MSEISDRLSVEVLPNSASQSSVATRLSAELVKFGRIWLRKPKHRARRTGWAFLLLGK